VSARIPRLEFDQLAPALRAQLEPRVTRLGYLGEFFRCTGHQPDLLVPFMTMTEAFKKVLPDKLTELGALTVAGVMGNDYERNQHERLSFRLGFGKEWIADVNALAPDRATRLDDTEKRVQRLIIAMIDRKGKGVDAELGPVVDVIGHQQAIAVMFLVGRYVTHALIVNSLGLVPPVKSVFEEEPR
jgi:hypothetical protein